MASSYSPRPRCHLPMVSLDLTSLASTGGGVTTGGGGSVMGVVFGFWLCRVGSGVGSVLGAGEGGVGLTTGSGVGVCVTVGEGVGGGVGFGFGAGEGFERGSGEAAGGRVAIYSPPPPMPISNTNNATQIPQRDSGGLGRKGGATTTCGWGRTTGGGTGLAGSTGRTGGEGARGETATAAAPRSPPLGPWLALARIRSSVVNTRVLPGLDM